MKSQNQCIRVQERSSTEPKSTDESITHENLVYMKTDENDRWKNGHGRGCKAGDEFPLFNIQLAELTMDVKPVVNLHVDAVTNAGEL